MGGSSAGSGSGNGGGSPNQMAKDKAAKDKAVKAKEDRQKKIREEQKNKRPTPRDDNKVIAPKPKPVVPKKTTPKVDPKPTVPKKPADYNLEKDDTGVKESIEKTKKKKTPVIIPNNGGGSDGSAVKKPIIKEVTETAPTIAEVDQATTDTSPTETAETTEANRLLKIKKKGRSQSIMTSAKGVTKTSSDYSLGRPSLLGRV